jgi:hypothetical protein
VQLIDAGMAIARFNFSHGDHQVFQLVVFKRYDSLQLDDHASTLSLSPSHDSTAPLRLPAAPARGVLAETEKTCEYCYYLLMEWAPFFICQILILHSPRSR